MSNDRLRHLDFASYGIRISRELSGSNPLRGRIRESAKIGILLFQILKGFEQFVVFRIRDFRFSEVIIELVVPLNLLAQFGDSILNVRGSVRRGHGCTQKAGTGLHYP